MFCPECGNFQGNGVEFCSFCGAKISSQPIDNETNTYSEPLMPAINEEKKKKGKKKVKILISLLLVAAILTSGVFIVPGVVLQGYTLDNVFYLAAKDIGKDHDNYPLMMALAATYNTLFNAKSFTFQWKNTDEEDLVLKAEYGSKWYMSDIYCSLPDSAMCLLNDGTIFYVDDDAENGMEGDLKHIFSSDTSFVAKFVEAAFVTSYENNVKNFEEILANQENLPQEDIDHFNELLDKYKSLQTDITEHLSDTKAADKAFSAIIKNRRINLKNVFEAVNFAYIEPVMSAAEILNNDDEEISKILSSVTASEGASYVDTVKLIVELIAKTDYSDALKVKDTQKGSGRNAETKYTITGNLIDLIECLVDEIDNSDKLREKFSNETIDKICEAARSYIENEDRDYFDFKITVETKGSYLSGLSLGNSDETVFEFEISDVNKTKVTEDEIEKVRKKYKKCDEVEYFGELDDLFPVND